MPTANRDFWAAKLSGNRLRDDRVVSELQSLGWTVITVWEHEIRPQPTQRASELADYLKNDGVLAVGSGTQP